MVNYKLTNTSIVIKLPSFDAIPDNQDNSDRKEYNLWLAAGNIPLLAEPLPTIDQISAQTIDGMDRIQNILLFRQENDLRDLRAAFNAKFPGTFPAGQANPITKADFRDKLIQMVKNFLTP